MSNQQYYISEIDGGIGTWDGSGLEDGGIVELVGNKVKISDFHSQEILELNINDMNCSVDEDGDIIIEQQNDNTQYISFTIDQYQGTTNEDYVQLLNDCKSEQGGGKKKKSKSNRKKKSKKRTKKSKKRTKKSKKRTKKSKSNRKRKSKSNHKKKLNQKGGYLAEVFIPGRGWVQGSVKFNGNKINVAGVDIECGGYEEWGNGGWAFTQKDRTIKYIRMVDATFEDFLTEWGC